MNVKYVFGFSLQLSSEIFLITIKIQRGVIKNVYQSPRKVSVLSDFNES
jgi:hypothetical protein